MIVPMGIALGAAASATAVVIAAVGAVAGDPVSVSVLLSCC